MTNNQPAPLPAAAAPEADTDTAAWLRDALGVVWLSDNERDVAKYIDDLRARLAAAETGDAADVAREVLCRVFDDGADVAMEEWRAWYKSEDWIWHARGLGAFIRRRLLAKRQLTAHEREGLTELLEAMAHPARDEASARVTISMRSANALCSALATTGPALAAAETETARLREDAERWRAVVGSARVRVLGSAGLHGGERADGKYAHIGLELWTEHLDAPDCEEDRAAFTRYADVARAIQPAPPEGS